jgi:hypothetical protein
MLLSGTARKMVDRVRQKGPLGLLRVALNKLRIALLNQSPARRRARRAAREFDRRHGTDTAGIAAVERTLPNAEHAVRYQPTGRDVFDQILRTLAVDCARFTFVDVGSGKGRVLLFAGDHPFARIVGIEFSPRLHAIAEKNVRVYLSPSQKCTAIEPVLGDATTVALPPGPLFVFMYNPFSEPIMSRFAENLRGSLAASPRDAWLVYLNPVERACFEGAAWLTKVHDADEWVAYRAIGGGANT